MSTTLEFRNYSPEVNRILLAADTEILSRKIRADFIAQAEKLQSFLTAREPDTVETDELQSNLSQDDSKDSVEEDKKQTRVIPLKRAIDILSDILDEVEDEFSSEESSEAVESLQVYLTEDKLLDAIAETLRHLKTACDISITHRAFAFEMNIQDLVLEILTKYPDEINVTFPGLEVLISMSKEQPHILNANGIFVMLQYLDMQIIAATTQQILRWMHVCMDRCENNRISFFQYDLLPRLMKLLNDDTTMSPTISDVCLVIRSLVDYDDSPDVYKYALDRITITANMVLSRLVNLLHKFLQNNNLLKELLFTIRKLLVTEDLCETLLHPKEGKGMVYVHDAFSRHLCVEELSCEILKIFYVMIGNDNLRTVMLDAGATVMIKKALDFHRDSESVTTTAFECIARATLKRPLYTKHFKNIEIPSRIIVGMETHVASYKIQKLGSWIIRIFITYEHLHDLFLEMNATDVLLKAIETHRSKCEYDAKAALRDLGYHTDITEPISQNIEDLSDIHFPL